MKKIILAIALFAAVSANAQSDGFFTYNNVEEQRTNESWGSMPAMIGHGSTTDMSAPLGSGLLLLGSMAVLYARRKKSN
jgi:LPXTG-motif cell wall-anchored protein